MTDKLNKLAKVRVDKWLWAARFFKTRSLAKAAIEGGKVQLDGQRVKVSREITTGDRLTIRQGWDEKSITIVALSDQRGPATTAQALYEESEESIARRERETLLRRAAGGLNKPNHRPDKHERKQISRLRRDGGPNPEGD
ncbi:S4 domain-containing protein [Luminiphilus sp.]|nr:S4 domain-containing protein [Luminiphilus sp.]MDA7840431.1 S4 domain-containing protein [Luminiphilus sp.]MDA8828127.1 S4 domain-containing protein [Luminiphilus sp.]MDB2615993.1 S4 domain-containing protein [Luminiphilus sp.]MDB3922765.1 S4 domain-containing protein [Luminiphilus sp.]